MFSFLCKGVAEVDVERGQELHLWLSPKRPQQRTTSLHWGGPGDWGCQVGFPFFFQKLQSSKSEFLRFKSSSTTGGSQQLEVFGKPVFTEAGNQRENSPIRWTIHFWKLLWSDKKSLAKSRNFVEVYLICILYASSGPLVPAGNRALARSRRRRRRALENQPSMQKTPRWNFWRDRFFFSDIFAWFWPDSPHLITSSL